MQRYLNSGLALSCHLLGLSSASGTTCYFPNGDIADLDVPCNAASPQTACCGKDWTCLSNNLCFATSETHITPGDAVYSRGSCTDSTWQSDSCFQECRNPDTDSLSGGLGVGKYNNTVAETFFCVNGVGSNCDTGENVFTFAAAPTVVKNPFSTSTTSTSSSVTSSPSTSSAGLSSAISSTAASSAAADATSVADISASATAGPQQGDTASSRTTAIGAGVGASLGALLIICIGALLWWFRRRARQADRSGGAVHASEQSSQNMLDQSPDPYYDQAPEYPILMPKKGDQQQHWPRHELSTEAEVYEMGQTRGKQELSS